MKVFNVGLVELSRGGFDVEADSYEEAREKVKQMIADDSVPDWVLDETDGYEIDYIDERFD